jgi:hypothetical protein
MKEKISAHLDTGIVRLAKQLADEERRPLDELIQEALANYLRTFAATPKERKMAYQLFCGRPMSALPDQLR